MSRQPRQPRRCEWEREPGRRAGRCLSRGRPIRTLSTDVWLSEDAGPPSDQDPKSLNRGRQSIPRAARGVQSPGRCSVFFGGRTAPVAALHRALPAGRA